MRPEDHFLFACTRQDFGDEYQRKALEISRRYTLDWEQVFSKAERHGIAGLLYINLCQSSDLGLGIPASIVDHYRLYTLRNAVRKEQQLQRLLHALEYLQERSIPALLIKGVVLELLVYEQSAFCTLNDIDLVLKVRREQLTKAALEELMNRLQGGIEYDFYEHHDMTINGALPIDFERIWRDAAQIDLRGQPVWVMCPEDMLISLCINSCRKRFFRLKSLLDIAESIRKVENIHWDKLVAKARSYDCANIVYTALLVTSKTLGCDLPWGLLDAMQIHRVRKALINGIVSYGLRYGSLPVAPISGKSFFGKQIHVSLVLPYAAYRFYQIRHKILHEIL